MLIRSTALLVLVCALSPIAQADQFNSEICIESIEERSTISIGVCTPQLSSPFHVPFEAGMPGGYDLGSYSKIVRQIAIYESVGNRDGAEILKAQLLACGVSREAVTEGVAWAKINGTESGERHDPTLQFMAPDMGW